VFGCEWGIKATLPALAGSQYRAGDVQRFYYFGVEKAIANLFTLPEFVAARGKGRKPDDPSSIYGSPAFKTLNERTVGLAAHDNTSLYGLGCDWVKIFNFKDYSIGIVGLRCEDMEAAYMGKQEFHMPVMIISGPDLPRSVDGYFEVIGLELEKLWKEGMVVTPAGDGRSFTHHVLLGSITADFPARAKIGNFAGSASAYLACHNCTFCGTRQNNRMLFLGYTGPEIMM